MKNKIILGSANFDQKYGIRKNFIQKSEIKKIFNLAHNNAVKIIDTSPLYKESEKIIGSLNNNRFKIISKIPNPPKGINKENIKYWLKQNVITSLKNLKINKFECLLIHNANCLLSKNGNEIYKSIKNMQVNGFTNKVGVSIYDFNILNKILKRFKFNIIQVPFNILDQRLIEEGWLKKLKKKNIDVHVRSIFLQGILLLKHNELPKKLKKLNKKFMLWEKWLKKNKFSPLQICLNFVLQHNQIDGFVIGFNNSNQFNQFLKFKKIRNDFLLPNLNVKNKKLVDPRKWFN